MKPHIFLECEGCENHRYTYANKFINYIGRESATGREIADRIDVEPETHYCSPTGGVYRKLHPANRPYGCLRAPKSTIQEENQMSDTALTTNAEAGGVPAEPRDLNIITAEIRFYKHEAGKSILEIGRRLIEAKEQLEHGEWLDWLTNQVDFSDVAAQRFMRLAREYSNPSPVTDLGASKALALLALPDPEREAFMGETHDVNGEEKSVADMSKRELEKAVRERAEALRQKAEAEAAAEEAKRIAEENAVALAAADERAAEAQAEVERLQEERKSLVDELEQVRDAEPALPEEPDQQTFEVLRKEAAMEAKKDTEEKLKKKIEAADKAKTEAEKKVAIVQAERDHIQKAAERERVAAEEKISALEKRLAVASSETVTIFKTHFESIQGPINAMLGCLEKLKDAPDTRDKLAAALRAICEKTLAELPGAAIHQAGPGELVKTEEED